MHEHIAHDKAITGFDPLVRADSQRNSVSDRTAEGAKGRPSLRANATLKLTLLFFFAIVLSFAAVSLAQTGDVWVQFNGGGADNKVFIGEENHLQIFIKNPGGAIKGMTLGFGFTSAVAGFSWKTPYGNKPNPGPYSPNKYVQEYADAVDTFDPNGLQFGTWLLPNSFLIGGTSTSQDLPVHATSTMLYDLVLIMPADPSEYVGGFCIDNISIPPAGYWIFDQGSGVSYPPTFQGNGNISKIIPSAPPVCFDIVHRSGGDIAFYGWPRQVGSGEQVFFTGVENTVTVTSWDWNFGDGTVHGTGQYPTHSYANTGSYTIILTAATSGGPKVITGPGYIQVDPPQADFSTSPRVGIAPLPVNFTDASSGVPTPTGWYWDFGDGTYETIQNPAHTYTSPGVYNVCLTVSNNPGSYDTRCYLANVHVDAVATPDLEVQAYACNVPRPGFHRILYLAVRNLGTGDAPINTLSLDLSLLSSSFPPDVTYFGSTPAGTVSLDGKTVTWPLPIISWDPSQYVFSDQKFVVDFYVDPSAPIGEKIETTASVDATGETVTSNNTVTSIAYVKASWDPNDKFVQPAGCGSRRAVKGDERLSYTISFENKAAATAPATYVLVFDTLDPNLDWATLQVGPSSKDNVLTFDFDPISGEMVWFFDGYDLPPNHNPPEGEGFVSYSISPKPGLSEGALIKNLAHIRFDYESWLAAPTTGPLQLSISNQDLNHNGIIDACEFICGDANGSGNVDISDAVYLISYIFSGGSAPVPLLAGDANCSANVDISDAVYLISYIFSGGSAPCAGCK